eukprot:3677681-Pleurochrysis_carterae.AAC.1
MSVARLEARVRNGGCHSCAKGGVAAATVAAVECASARTSLECVGDAESTKGYITCRLDRVSGGARQRCGRCEVVR